MPELSRPLSPNQERRIRNLFEDQALDQHTDVEVPSPTDGYVLTWVAANSQWEAVGGGGGAVALDDLTDVTISAPSTGQYIRYNGSLWVNTGLAIVDDPSPQLAATLDAQGKDIDDLANITFRTGASGGTIRTGVSAADKFELQAYDTDDTTYRTVMELDAGADVVLQIIGDYLAIEDAADTSKHVEWDLGGMSTGIVCTLDFNQTAARTITFPDETGTIITTNHSDLSSTQVTGIQGRNISNSPSAINKYLIYNNGTGDINWGTIAVPAAPQYDAKLMITRNAVTADLSTAFASLEWDTQVVVDTAEFTHSTSTNASEITIDNAIEVEINVDVTADFTGTPSSTNVNTLEIKLQYNTGAGWTDFTDTLSRAPILSSSLGYGTCSISHYYSAGAGDKIRVQARCLDATAAKSIRIASDSCRLRMREIQDGS